MNWIILSIIPVSVPMWEVYCQKSPPELFMEPVLALALCEYFTGIMSDEEEKSEAKINREVLPLTNQGGYIGISGYPGSKDASNLLGYSHTCPVDPEDWKEEIAKYMEKGDPA